MGPGLAPGTLSAAPPPPALNTDRWFYGVFQSAPDLIRWLAEPSPGLDASLGAVPLDLDRQSGGGNHAAPAAPARAGDAPAILASRRDLELVVFSMLFERFPQLSKEEILMNVGLPQQELPHTRAVQEILEEGRQGRFSTLPLQFGGGVGGYSRRT